MCNVLFHSAFCRLAQDTSFNRCVANKKSISFVGSCKAEYDVKVRGKLGPDKADDKHITILNKCVEWTSAGLQYEPDPRHVEILLRELGMENCTPVATPGVKMAPLPEDEDQHLSASEPTKFWQTIARCNSVCQDRPDIQYAVKEAARGMANPRQSH